MSDQKKADNEPKLTAYERWELPHLTNKSPKETTGPAILIQKEPQAVTEEVDHESLVYEPLTASQLEEIRSAAYDEGFIQGEEEGHGKGYSDGFSKGEVDGFEKGHEDGRLLGIEEGKAQAKAEAEQQFAVIEALLSGVAQEITTPLEESRSAIEETLYRAMERIVENVCLLTMRTEGSEVLKVQLSRVLDEIGEYEGRVRLRLHPDDSAILEALNVTERLALKIETDEALTSGDFIIDSKSFYIDGRLETRLAAVFDELRQLSLTDLG